MTALANVALLILLSISSGCAAAAPGAATGRGADGPAAAAAGTAGAAVAAAAGGATSGQDTASLPAGFGTLRQDELTVALRDGPLLIKATPLDEQVIRLLAPDSYRRLSALAASRRAAAGAASDGAELFLLSFFSYEPNVAFQPEDVRIVFQGRQLQAARIEPVSDGFGRQLLAQQESQSAIYAFEARLDYNQPILVRYGTRQSDDWTRVIPMLEIERAKIRARAGGGR